MNARRKAILEQRRQREEQLQQRAAEQSAPVAATRRVEVVERPVHDGLGGKYLCGQVVTETAENSAAIDAWLARGWARLTT